jgi:peroxiredoxin family protein
MAHVHSKEKIIEAEHTLAKMAIVLGSDHLDKVFAAFQLANTAAASDIETVIYFTIWGVNVIKKGEAEKLSLSRDYSRYQERLKKGMEETKSPSISKMITDAKELGIKFLACETWMALLGVKKEDLIDEVDDVVGYPTFTLIAKDANLTFFI